MSTSELTVVSQYPTEGNGKTDAEYARESLTRRGDMDDIVSYGDRISGVVVTGYLKRNRARAAAVVLWSPDNNNELKGIRISYLQHLRKIEFTGIKSGTDNSVYWMSLELKPGEGSYPSLFEQLSMARGNANGRIPREKIFGDW